MSGPFGRGDEATSTGDCEPNEDRRVASELCDIELDEVMGGSM